MNLHINLINGTPNYTVTFSPSVSGSPFTFDSKGIKSFFGLPEDNYTITGVDVNGCEYILNYNLSITTTTTTN